MNKSFSRWKIKRPLLKWSTESRRTLLLTILKKLRKHYSKEEVNTKILRILSKKNWESRVTFIKEAHDLSKLSTDILIGKLLSHELTLKQTDDEKDEKIKEKKKGIALKAIQEASHYESTINSSEEDDEIAMFTRGFKKFLKRKSF